MSFEFNLSDKDRVSNHFIHDIRKQLINKAIANDICQQKIADKLNTKRSVLNRILRNRNTLSLRMLAEISWALDCTPIFNLKDNDKC